MNKELLSYVRHLSEKDTKNLSQKFTKLIEESGELARVVLPYENAYATTHRFVEREKILEESIDVILCALSIAYDLRFSDDEVESMMAAKSEKWAKLQTREDGVTYPLPYEIHVTVKLPYIHPHMIETFRDDCKAINVKPIVLDLQGKRSDVSISDVMTSSKHFGDNRSAYEEARRIEYELKQRNYEVVRVKIETVPWHPAAPQTAFDKMPANCYFEAHVPFIIEPEQHAELRAAMAQAGECFHVSQNVFKRTENGKAIVMVTFRDTCSRDFFEAGLRDFTNDFCFQWDLGKIHTEFSIYDTKVSHDIEWVNAT